MRGKVRTCVRERESEREWGRSKEKGREGGREIIKYNIYDRHNTAETRSEQLTHVGQTGYDRKSFSYEVCVVHESINNCPQVSDHSYADQVVLVFIAAAACE